LETSVRLKPLDSASICIVIHGEGEARSRTVEGALTLRRGSAIFISAGEEVNIDLKVNSGMLMFRAHAGI
jgi:mannose-6-phosphate isomerase class I